ncbi:MAG TPA: hypothetical protein VGR52_09535 [Stellaceae bacterium]|nr:hypothetical protein [Stellaceae bacterium]
MPSRDLIFTLSYSGADSDDHAIDFYDVAQALIGFERSLALTTHLILNNGEIITQAPSLEGAKIFAVPPADGSWKIDVIVVATFMALAAPHDSVLGNLVTSAYDYVISETLGFHVDYNKTLQKQYDEYRGQQTGLFIPPQAKLDSLTEKTEVAIKNMHRPIVWSETASQAVVTARIGSGEAFRIGHPLDRETFDYIDVTERAEHTEKLSGHVSSYNVNTYKGRIYLPDLHRPIPFELAETCRDAISILALTQSLMQTAQDKWDAQSAVAFTAFKMTSKSGRLKKLLITSVGN